MFSVYFPPLKVKNFIIYHNYQCSAFYKMWASVVKSFAFVAAFYKLKKGMRDSLLNQIYFRFRFKVCIL